MEETQDSMVEEEKERLIISIVKKASSIKHTSPFTAIDDPKKLSLRVTFRAWPCPLGQQDWKTWVHQMAPLHQSTWKKAGVCEAIFNSAYHIKRQNDLVWGFAEKWSSETNTFNFPWGEATITLEDVMVLGGFSVSGDSISSPLETTEEMKIIKDRLLEEGREIYKNSKGRAVTTSLWQKRFMNCGNELEHEAFLMFWLSRYVLLGGRNLINNNVIPIAIRLARGTRIALAPAVLASVYKDLSLLKNAVVHSSKLTVGTDTVLEQILKSPFQLVQVWAWERFLDLRPEKLNAIENADQPRMARWDNVDGKKVENLRVVLDSAEFSSEAIVPQKKTEKSVKEEVSSLGANNYPFVPPGFPPKCRGKEVEDCVNENKLTMSQPLKRSKKDNNFGIMQDCDSGKLSSQQRNLDPLVVETLKRSRKDKDKNSGIRLDSGDCGKLSSQHQSLASPIVEDGSGNTVNSADKDVVSIVGNEGASTCRMSSFEKRLSELKVRYERVRSVVDQFKAHSVGNKF